MAGLFNNGLEAYWRNVSAIGALVGGTGLAARIWPDAAREKQPMPYAVYVRVSSEVHRDLSGAIGCRSTVVHLYCWGDTRNAADDLAEEFKRATEDGTIRGTYGSTYINWVFVLDIDYGHDYPIDGSDRKKFWTRIVFRVIHSES